MEFLSAHVGEEETHVDVIGAGEQNKLPKCKGVVACISIAWQPHLKVYFSNERCLWNTIDCFAQIVDLNLVETYLLPAALLPIGAPAYTRARIDTVLVVFARLCTHYYRDSTTYGSETCVIALIPIATLKRSPQVSTNHWVRHLQLPIPC